MGRGGGGGGGHSSSHHSSSHTHHASSSHSHSYSSSSSSSHSSRSSRYSGGSSGGSGGGCFSTIVTLIIIAIIGGSVYYGIDGELPQPVQYFLIERSTIDREVLPSSKCTPIDVWYQDDWGDWINEEGEEEALIDGMKAFYEVFSLISGSRARMEANISLLKALKNSQKQNTRRCSAPMKVT